MASSLDELRRLRRLAAARTEATRRGASFSPNPHRPYIGQVYNGGAKPTSGGFVYYTHPVTITGNEVEGSAGTFAADTTRTVPVWVFNQSPAVGDYVIAELQPESGMWVATFPASGGHSSGGGHILGCFCDPLPLTLNMLSADPTCNYGMFQTCTIGYQATPAPLSSLSLGAFCYLSTTSFPDIAGDVFYYFLTCNVVYFTLTRVYPTSRFGDPFRDNILWSWLIGFPGNTCSPFLLSNGSPYAGSDASCLVTIYQ